MRMYVGLFYINADKATVMSQENILLHIVFMLALLIPSYGYTLKWFNGIRIQVMIILYQKNTLWFKIFTMNLVDKNEFYKDFIVEDGPGTK